MRFGDWTKLVQVEAEPSGRKREITLRMEIDNDGEIRWVEARLPLNQTLGRDSAGWHNGGPRPDVKLRFLPVGYQPEDQGQDQQPEDKPEPAPAKRKARPREKKK